MNQLPPKAAALLEAARQQHEPSEGERAHTRAAVFAALSLSTVEAEPTPPGTDAADHAPASTPATSSIAGVGAKLIFVATLALGGAGFWALSPPRPRRIESVRPFMAEPSAATRVQPPARTPAFEAKVVPARRAALDQAEAAHEPAVTPLSEAATANEAALVSRPQVNHHRRTTVPQGASGTSSTRVAASSVPLTEREAIRAAAPALSSSAEPTSAGAPAAVGTQHSVIAELVLVRRALNELNTGRPEAALHTLAEHRANYPSGALTSEREGLFALALCANGQREAGQRQKAAFLSKYEDSPLATRLRGACTEAEH